MKNFHVPLAIIIGSIIIAGTLYYTNKNDPLTRCTNKMMKEYAGTKLGEYVIAVRVCTGNTKR
tara:strand:- start:1402 stop:1590 length:189 start_codon:yes stop_codon:yes gene_type:complete